MNLQLICRSWCYQPFKKCWYVCCGQQNHDLTMRLSKRIDRVRYNQMQTSPIASDTSTRLHVLIPSLIYRRKLGNCFMAIVLSDVFLWDAEHVAVARSSRDCTIGPPLRLNLKHTKTSKNECPTAQIGCLQIITNSGQIPFQVGWRMHCLIYWPVTMQRCTQK
jgi:hypothetical protein